MVYPPGAVMANYEITAPNGRRFVVTAPEGASQDDVLRYAQQNMDTSQPDERGPMERVAAVPGQFGAGVNEGIARFAGAVPDLLASGQRMLPGAMGRNAAPPGYFTSMARSGLEALTGGPAPEARGMAEKLARGAGTGAVDAAAMLVPAAAVARATTVAGQAPSLANRLATTLSAQPGMQAAAGMVGGAVGEATDNPLLGTAAAFATPLAASMVGRVLTPVRSAPNAEREALVRYLESERVPVTAGQATGNRFLQNVESTFEQLPFTNGAQRDIREAQGRAFTAASLRNAGVASNVASPDVLNNARSSIGGGIGAIANRNTMEVTPQLATDLRDIADSLRFIPAEAAGPVRARLEQIVGMATPGANGGNPTIPGASYRMMDSQLGRSMRGTSNGDLRAALGDLRERLRTAMDASISPDDAAEWAQLRRQYANLMVTAKAAGGAGAGAAEGQVSPLALRGAVDQSTGRNYAFGAGDQNELARAGQSILRAPPDSGTSGRASAASFLQGGGVLTGAGLGGAAAGPLGAVGGAAASVALPRMAQMLMNSPAGQAYLRNQLIQNPILTQRLAASLLGQQAAGNAVSP